MKEYMFSIGVTFATLAFIALIFLATGCPGYLPPDQCPPPPVCPECEACPAVPEPLDPAKYAMQCGVHQWGFTFAELGIDPSECVELPDGPWGLDAGVEWRGVEHYCKCIVVPPMAFEGEHWIFKGVTP